VAPRVPTAGGRSAILANNGGPCIILSIGSHRAPSCPHGSVAVPWGVPYGADRLRDVSTKPARWIGIAGFPKGSLVQ